MRNEPKKLVCGFAIALLVSFGPSHAGTVVSNLDETVAATAVVSAGNPFAQEFNAGGGGSFELSSIVAALGGASGSFTASAELVLVANNLPDNNSVVATFTASSIGSSFGDVTFTPTTSVTLSRNVSYYFVLAASGSGSYQWQYTNTTSSTITKWATGTGSLPSPTWTLGTPPGPFLIAVNSVPEPSSLALIALGVPAIAIAVHRRRRELIA